MTRTIAAMCFVYFIVSCWLNANTMISIDEFWYAHRIYQYHAGLPYRDFSPYKTVLGYYVLLLPMLFTHGFFHTLITLKITLSLINAAAFFGAGVWLSRFFNARAVVLGLLVVIASETVLTYASQIRTDMLAYWCCCFALLALLDKRFTLAGVLMGLGFLISQKVIWYWFASDVGLGMVWLIHARNKRTFIQCVKYNLIIVSLIILYAAFWSWISSGKIVWDSLVVEASIMYHLDWYLRARHLFWHIILTLNPFLFLLAPLTLVSLFTPRDKNFHQRLFIVPTALTVLLCLVPYKQVFPYYMQVTLPAFLLLYVSFFAWLTTRNRSKPTPFNLTLAISTLSLASIFIIAMILMFNLPRPYFLLLAFPLSVFILLQSKSHALKTNALTSLIIASVFVGGIYPLSLFYASVLRLNNNYQQANLLMARSWLQGGGDYLAGVEFFYDYNQPIAGMRHLIGPAIDYLDHPTPALRAVMTASQYEDPNATLTSVIQAINSSHVAFYLNNYRMDALPREIKTALNARYLHWWGSLYTYAPLIAPSTHEFTLAFQAPYRILSPEKFIMLDGKTVATDQIIILNEGSHTSLTKQAFRLQRVPPNTALPADPRYQNDELAKLVF